MKTIYQLISVSIFAVGWTYQVANGSPKNVSDVTPAIDNLSVLSLSIAKSILEGSISGPRTFERKDHTVDSDEGHSLHITEITPTKQLISIPLLMVHGGGPGSTTSFDLPVKGGSFAEEFVKRGYKVYLLNIRGWEKSTLPAYDFSDSIVVVGSVEEASRDIHRMVDWVLAKEKVDQVSLFGWATGGHWIGHFLTQHGEKANAYIALNMMYGVKAPWNLRDYFASERDSTEFNKSDFWRISPKESLTRSWTNTIPSEDKDAWRDPNVAQAYRDHAVKFGTDSTVLKIPGGYREESFYLSLGKKYWEAVDIQVPSLIIRSEHDFWSRPEDLVAMKNELIRSPKVKTLTIPGTHYVFIDRLQSGKQQLLDEIFAFLSELN